MRKQIMLVRIIILFCPMFLSVLQASARSKARYAVEDNHLHYYNFIQWTDGFEKLLKAMDDAGVQKAVLFGMPLAKMWTEADPFQPTYNLDTDSRLYYYSATDFLLANELLKQPSKVQGSDFPLGQRCPLARLCPGNHQIL